LYRLATAGYTADACALDDADAGSPLLATVWMHGCKLLLDDHTQDTVVPEPAILHAMPFFFIIAWTEKSEMHCSVLPVY
jgi:hypothetical protein